MNHMLKIVGVRDFPTTEQLLVMGGDERIKLNGGMNKYGCRPLPDPELLAFGSSTASVISQDGFAVAEKLRVRLLHETDEPEAVYAREMQRIRQELLQLCAVSDAQLLFATSGTDIHYLVARHLVNESDRQIRVVMVEENETGSGVMAALKGFNGAPFARQVEVVTVPLRFTDGAARPIADIDADVISLVDEAVDKRVLLIMVDQSKTGLIAPSPACAAQLLCRDLVDVMVDACQFRISAMTLNSYLRQGFMVALTGSKFLAGPSFSAALLLPARANCVLQSDFEPANFGLLLRWEVALAELRRFYAAPSVVNCLQAFAQAVQHLLKSDARFEPLDVPLLERQAPDWDQHQTIFPFLLYHVNAAGGRVPFSRDETLRIYRLLQVGLSQSEGSNGRISSLRCQLGQPVACGMREGIAVSALRICIGARQIAAFSGVIDEAMAALDKTAYLVDLIDD